MPHLPRSVNLEFMVTDLARGAAYYGGGREFGLREGNKLYSTPDKLYFLFCQAPSPKCTQTTQYTSEM